MTSNHSNRVAVRIERTIQAPPRDVYRAWLDPELVRRWMAPGFEVTRVEIDARLGGHYRVWHAKSGIEAGGFEAEILTLIPDQQIVFRWGFVGPKRREGPVYDSTLTIELRESSGGATLLILTHDRLDELEVGMPEAADKVEMGWTMVIEKLAMLCDTAKETQDA